MTISRSKPLPRWTIARAKERFSELVRAAQRSPQVIYNRDRAVAVIVDGETFRGLAAAQARSVSRTLEDAFTELRVPADDAQAIGVAERTTRPNPFADVLDELPR